MCCETNSSCNLATTVRVSSCHKLREAVGSVEEHDFRVRARIIVSFKVLRFFPQTFSSFYLPFFRSLAAALVFAVDSYAAKSSTFSPVNFLTTNIVRNVASFYGEHPGFWYFTNGIPMLLGALIIPFLYEIYKILRGPNRQTYDILMLIVFWKTVLVYR